MPLAATAASHELQDLDPSSRYRVQVQVLRGGTPGAPITTSFTTGGCTAWTPGLFGKGRGSWGWEQGVGLEPQMPGFPNQNLEVSGGVRPRTPNTWVLWEGRVSGSSGGWKSGSLGSLGGNWGWGLELEGPGSLDTWGLSCDSKRNGAGTWTPGFLGNGGGAAGWESGCPSPMVRCDLQGA